jgi:signal transduction histidine kinase
VRAVKASAQVFDCGAGALFWRPSEDLAFQPAGFWNWSKPAAGAAPPDALLRLVSAARPAVEVRLDQTFAADDAEDRAIREWLSRFKQPWILLALHVRGRLLGFILIGCPMLSRRLGWEDHELLSVLASQIGSYLAVEQMARQLAEAQRFETVSKQFSFVAHDLKNLITQLSIILEQARRHSGNPVFVEDALVTVGEAVEKMRTMLLRLRQTTPKQPEMLEVSELVERLIARANAGELQITFEKRAADLVVRAEPDDLNSVIQNDRQRVRGSDRS